MMYSFAKACSDGSLEDCKCAGFERFEKGPNWKWGGCGDNTKQAKKITRRFLQLKQNGDGPHNVLSYNSLVAPPRDQGTKEEAINPYRVTAKGPVKAEPISLSLKKKRTGEATHRVNLTQHPRRRTRRDPSNEDHPPTSNQQRNIAKKNN
ncbi:hypothetical protein ILUMI_22733 [Ignelater luminosus]|uniref:Protein Wnt n=1 Tax=Ignelater luminosus TaxID=2038154 RepID=A0A8K0G2J2_IGNLU|nr:hypothetical protein ILUMI_22733 [Ignelater luminosus]